MRPRTRDIYGPPHECLLSVRSKSARPSVSLLQPTWNYDHALDEPDEPDEPDEQVGRCKIRSRRSKDTFVSSNVLGFAILLKL